MGLNNENNYSDNLMEELLDKVNKMEKEIIELKRRLNENQQHYYPPIPVVPLDSCPNGGEHEYPFPWHSITPAPCKKCGKLSEKYEITFNTGTGNLPWDFNQHGGNVMNNENPIITNYNTISNSKFIGDKSGIN